MNPKYVIIVPDGAADYPIPQLGGKTIFEAARTPHLDTIARTGIQGLCYTVPPGLNPGSDVAMMAVLGYDARTCYTGRAPIEAVAQGIPLADTDWVFRCNLVTLENDTMSDHSAGNLTTEEGRELIEEINACCGNNGVRFYPGVGYRHLMVVEGKDFTGITTFPPHDNIGKPVESILPQGPESDFLRMIITRSQQVLEKHAINARRRAQEKRVANSVWFWGEGKKARMEPFEKKFGLKGTAITAVDLVRGLARLIRFDVTEVEGATGYFNTNYAGKGNAAIEALKTYDIVLVHIEATDEAGHSGEAETKKRALELIDEHIIGPVLAALQSYPQWRILVMPDHPTPVSTKGHVADAVPFAMAGTAIRTHKEMPFSEFNAAQTGVLFKDGTQLMSMFLEGTKE